MVFSTASCGGDPEATLSPVPTIGKSSTTDASVNSETTASVPIATGTPMIRDQESLTDAEALKTLATEYIERVYSIDEVYSPDYIDESTSVEDMISSVNQNGVSCTIKDILITGLEKINNDETAVNAIVTADYSSVWDEANEYYISMRIECVKKDGEWKVNTSDWYNYILSSVCNVEFDATSGEYMYIPIEGDQIPIAAGASSEDK